MILYQSLGLGLGLDCLSTWLTSLHHHDVDVSVQHHGARQVQLVGVGLHLELLSRVIHVTDPEWAEEWSETETHMCTL